MANQATALDRDPEQDPDTDGPEARAETGGHAERFLVKKGEHLHFLEADEIHWVQSQGNYVLIHAGNAKHLVRRTLSELEAQLDHRQFLRISRSVIINLRRVDHLVPWFTGGYVVRLTSGVQLKLTRRYSHRLFLRVGRPL